MYKGINLSSIYFCTALLFASCFLAINNAVAEIVLTDESSFIQAVIDQDVRKTKELLSRTHDPNASSLKKVPALILAVQRENLEIIEILLEAGAKITNRDQSGNDSLLWAVRKNNYDLVDLLLTWDAPVNSHANDGITPLMFAAYNGYNDLVELLLEAGADVQKTDYTGKNALAWSKLGTRGSRVVDILRIATEEQ